MAATGRKTNIFAPAAPPPPAPRDPNRLHGEWERVPDHNPYIPEWADPEWAPDVEYWSTGKWRRQVYVEAGQVLRPAILPRDVGKNPTEFARRFGIYPKADPSEQDPPVGRSLMSPRTDPREPAADPAAFESAWTEAESWQSYVFGGPTTQEMIASGAYIPSHRFSGPVIEGDLHPFLARDKWVNLWNILPDYIPNVRWKFGDQEGIYGADDDRVWAVMQPALRLVGRVLSSNHPFWNAILSLYHLRPVPPELDGRTDAVKQQAGAPLQSLWLDENKPGMYPAAAELQQMGFRSSDTTMAMLNQYLRFAIGTWERDSVGAEYAITFRIPMAPDEGALFHREPEPRIIIVEFPEVHTAATFALANSILHEMSHACRYAHEFLLREASFTLSTLRGVADLGITAEMAARFRPLGVQIYGTRRLPENYFFEECPQSEEGKAFETQLWGDSIVLGPPIKTTQVTNLPAYVLACSWPWGHQAPDLQHEGVNRSFYAPYARGAYSGFLLNPPAPVYDQWRPVKVDSYERFFRESWWQGEFQKFGHQALRFTPPFDALMVLPTSDSRFIGAELERELGEADYDFITQTAFPLLYDVKQYLLAEWLMHETEALVIRRATRQRLKFEARTWQRTYAKINSQIDKCLADVGELGTAIDGWIADSTAGRLTDNAQTTIKTTFERAAGTIVSEDLMVIDRLLRYSIQYAQALIAMYSLLPKEDDRIIVHHRYMAPLRNHLNSVRDKLDALTQRLDAFVDAVSRVSDQNFLATLLVDLRTFIRAFLQIALINKTNLVHTTLLLSDELIAPGFDYTRHPETLPAVPEARKRLSLGAGLKKAALRPLRYLTGDDRNSAGDVVRRWMGIIEAARNARADVAMEDA